MAESHAVIPIAEYRRMQSIINDLEEKVSVSIREIQRLETALRPFANAYEKARVDDYRQGWLTTMGNWLELKHFRDAADALFLDRDTGGNGGKDVGCKGGAGPMNEKHYRWYNDLTTGLTIFPDQEKRSLESLLFEYAHGEEGDECLDEPYDGAGYCVCAVCQVLAPIAAELERQYRRETAENARLQTALYATLDALDGLYGADRGEVIPIELLPEDRQQLFHKALELVGAALDGREETR